MPFDTYKGVSQVVLAFQVVCTEADFIEEPLVSVSEHFQSEYGSCIGCMAVRPDGVSGVENKPECLGFKNGSQISFLGAVFSAEVSQSFVS